MPLVLIVEDDTIIRDALGDALSNAGHTVRGVDSTLAGLRELHRDPPDLVILDTGLPDLDGAEALRMMRAVSDGPVIVATARRGGLDAIRLLNAGADDYLMKPFSAAHVLARVAAVLRRARNAQREAVIVEIGPLRLDESA